MKSLGAAATKEQLIALTSGLEFVEAVTGSDLNLVTLSFVRYTPGSRSGKFHQYVSVEVSPTVFKEWEATLPFRAAWLRVNIDGKLGDVERTKYVAAKTKQLREFGYPSLTEKEVEEQIDAVKSKKEFGEGLTVIGMFMKDEIV